MPNQQYSVAELNLFATSNRPSAVNRPAFLSTLLNTMLQPDTSRANKATLCKHLALLMTDQDSLVCHGADRQGNYFASYCVDLALQELEQQFSAAMEQDLRNVLAHWVNTLCPAQTSFNINGVIYTRTEVLDMLRAPNFISRQIHEPTDGGLAGRLERRLQGQGISSTRQTVHDPAVQDNGIRVLNIMRTKHGQVTEASHAKVTSFITKAANNRVLRTTILAGMTDCLNNTNRDNNWSIPLTPQQAIKDVVQYIESIQDSSLRSNLTDALLNRLQEIHLEGPCVSGVLQRLLDVPNGIDPDMNFAGRAQQIGEEMATLAGKTNAQLNELIQEGVQAIPEQERNPDTAQTIASQIGRNMFDARVDQDMKLRGGIPETELATHRERLQAGFN
ncbi:MAG TPA: hypothetical protein VFV43_08680 [Limnobacter sp.]|nr:hypothetical protein [Limnobacter sp.]